MATQNEFYRLDDAKNGILIELNKAHTIFSDLLKDYDFPDGLNFYKVQERPSNEFTWIHRYERIYTYMTIANSYIFESIEELNESFPVSPEQFDRNSADTILCTVEANLDKITVVIQDLIEEYGFIDMRRKLTVFDISSNETKWLYNYKRIHTYWEIIDDCIFECKEYLKEAEKPNKSTPAA